MQRLLRINLLRLLVVVLFVSFGGSTFAASANLSHSYNSKVSIPDGSIVSLDSKNPTFIDLSNDNNENHVIGVSLQTNQSLLAVNPSQATVQVAISGTVDVLASTVNGNINSGDDISVSPFDGIGMKAPASNGRVIGIALNNLDNSTPESTSQVVSRANGQSQNIQIGFVKIHIAIGTSGSGQGVGNNNGTQLNFLQNLIKSLTGHSVSLIRILLSIIVCIMSLISVITLIYASIHGSIISIGRNPLSEHAIYKSLIVVVIVAFLSIAIACVTIFYLLH